ncbi:MAG: Tex family protein [Casimicrobiaceae bacterium]
MPESLITRLARDVNVSPAQVEAAVRLLDQGATVPFIARYRKEATQGLDDAELRLLAERLEYLRELDERRESVIEAIRAQGKLTEALARALDAAETKQAIEDLYAPYKQKRRTKAQIAREAGLEPLADALLSDPTRVPLALAEGYVNAEAGFAGPQAALDGARDLLAERWAEDATLVGPLREWLWQHALFTSRVVEGKAETEVAAKFRDYFDYAEPIARVPSHRALAVFRGWLAEVLTVKLEQPVPEGAPAGTMTPAEARIASHLGWRHQGRAADDWIRRTIGWCWRVKLAPAAERDLFARLREEAEAVAIRIFGENLRELLLAPPAGARPVMGLDPGIRTGVKVAVVDETGKVVATETVYPHEPRRDWQGALATLERLCRTHAVELIAIGNGTASRETDRLAAELVGRLGGGVRKVVISEAGASVYSASEYASEELPELDVSLRGAVSIARRLQDPLAELVKIDPKSIGVGQYQHDVNQSALARKLDAVVEDCVNAVGVDVNLASAPLLARVAGLTPALARAIVRHRDEHGAFADRRALLEVSGLGPKTFEQCAGFLRIHGGANPLDASAVHPESYPLVEAVLARVKRPLAEILGRSGALKSLPVAELTALGFGEATVRDVLAELEKPGRDPRGEFRVARFNEGVTDLADLREGMILEGTVTNVAAFGAFVDIGVHQDGLVHVSQLASRYVRDPNEIVKAGQIVRVKVLEVDLARKRIALSMRLDAEPTSNAKARGERSVGDPSRAKTARQNQPQPAPTTAMAAAFAALRR